MKGKLLFSIVFFLTSVLISVYAQPGSDCATAISVSSNGCSAASAYNNAGITGTLSAPSCFDAGTNNGMWFKFVASGLSVNINVNGASLTQSMVSLLAPPSQGNQCGGGTFSEVACHNPSAANSSIVYSALTVGSTYYIYVDGANALTGTFQLCLSSPAQPTNDNICNAITLQANNFCSPTGAYTTVGATPEPIFSTSIPGCFGSATNTINGVWFKYTAIGPSNSITVNGGTGTGLQRPQVAVLIPTGNNCSATSFGMSGCASAATGVNTVTVTAANFIAGQTYYILVEGYDNNNGNFQICVNSFVPTTNIQNDECANAINLCPSSLYYGTTIGSSPNSANDPYINPISGVPNAWNCNGIVDNTVWYKFTTTTPASDINFSINSVCKPVTTTNPHPYPTGGNIQFEVFRKTTTGNPCSSNTNWSSVGCTAFSTATGSASLSIPAANLLAGTTYYVVIDNFPECGCDFNFSVTGNLGASAGPDLQLCLNSSGVQNLVGSPAGGTWTGPGITNPTGSFDPIVAGIGVHTVYYTQGGCSSPKKITVASPQVTVGSNQTICAGQSVQLIGDTIPRPSTYPITFSSTGGPIAITDNKNAGVTSTINVTGIAPTTVATNPIVSVCLNITHTFVSDLTLQLICPGGTTINLVKNRGGSGDNFNNTCFVPSGAPSIITGTAPFAGTFTPENPFSSLVGCLTNGVWTLKAIDGSPGDIGSIQNWNITFNNNNKITSFNWSPTTGMTNSTSMTPTVSPTTSPTVYTLTATDVFGCSNSSSATITVNPTPIVTQPANISVCANGTVPVSNFLSTPAGATFAWTNTNTAIGLAASGNGNVPSFTATNSTNAAISGTISVIPTLNGCVGPAVTYTITVNPIPTVTAPTNVSVCPGVSVSATSLVSVPVGATYAWTNTNTAIGLATSGTGNVPSFTAANSTSAAISGTISIIPTLNTCVGTAVTYTITVDPVPAITAPASSTLCGGSNVAATNIVSTPAGATYTWTNSITSIGLAANGTGNVPSFTTVNTSNAAVTSTISITPSLNGCIGLPVNYTITVDPAPVIVAPANVSVCAGNSVAATTIVSNPVGAALSWTNSNTAIGLAASGTGNVPSFTATNSTNAAITANISVTPSASGCTGASVTYTITVSPTPSINPITAVVACGGTNIPTSNYTSSTTGTVFNWTNSNTSIGIGASGTGNINSFTATNSGTSSISANINVTPSLNGCIGLPTNYTITVNSNPVVSASATEMSCAGIVPCDGTLSSSVTSGGDGNFTYNWSGITPAVGQNKSNVCGGNYTVTVTDGNGCQGTASAIVNEPTSLVATASSNDASCFGVCDGIVAANTASGGKSPYTYTWSVLGVGQSFNNACAGTYDLTIKDANNCTLVIPNLVVAQPTQVSATSSNIMPAACGSNTGSFDVSGSGGSPAYQFSLDNTSSYSPSTSYSNLSGGAHTLYIKDSKGCTDNIQVVIPSTGGFSSAYIKTDITCFGLTNGSVTVDLTGGDAPFSYKLDNNAAVLDNNNTYTFNNLSSGSHQVLITDNLGCVSNVSFVISEPSAISIAPITQTNNTCNVSNDASVNVVASGGTGTLSYNIGSGPQANGSFTSLSAGAYTVTILDANGCTATQPVNISEPAAIVPQIASQTNVSCYGLSNGSITLSASGGTGPYTYSSDNITFGSNAVFSGLVAGNYTYYIKDFNGCLVNIPAIITQPAKMVVSVNPPNPEICEGNRETLTASGAFTYSWSPASGLSATTGSVVDAFPISTSTYTVTGTASNGCTKDTTVIVTVNPNPIMTIVPNNPTICSGGSVSLTASGNIAIQSYQWSPNQNIVPGTNFATVSVNPSSSVSYGVIGTTSKGCSGNALVLVTVVSLPNITVTPTAATICTGETAFLQASGADSYEWTTGGSVVATGDSYAPSPTLTTTYTVTGTISGSCTNSTTVTITVNPKPNVTVVPNNPIICQGGNVTLSANGAMAYAWTLAGSPAGNTQNITVSPTTMSTYTVEGTNTITGCKNTATTTVFVNPLPILVVNPATICNGSTTQLNVTGANTYSWIDPLGGTLSATTGATVDAFPTSTTTYIVSGTDNNTCTSSTTVTVTVNNNPIIIITPSANQICIGENVQLSATGALNYSWTPTSELNSSTGSLVVATPLTVGNKTYTVTGLDANNCQGTNSVNIVVNDLPVVSLSANNAICFGENVNLDALSNSIIVAYNWSSPQAHAGIPAGSNGSPIVATPSLQSATSYVVDYVVGVTDNNGCFSSDQVSVNVNYIPVVTAVASPATICIGETSTLTGGTDVGFLYSWVGQDLNTNSSQTVIASPTVPGSYTYTVTGTTSPGGCTSTADVDVLVRDALSLTVLPAADACSGDSVQISVMVTGGLPPYDYTWENGGGNNSFIKNFKGSSTLVYPPSSDIFTVSVKDFCSTPMKQEQVPVTINPLPLANFIPVNGCEPLNALLLNSSDIQPGLGVWNFDNGSSSTDWDGSTVFASAGDYNVTLTVTDNSKITSCSSSISKKITVFPNPEAHFEYAPLTIHEYNPVVKFDASASRFDIFNYNWNFGTGDTLNLPGTIPTTNYAFPDTGYFNVILTVRDGNNCEASYPQTIYIEPDFAIFIPNAFSPNGDAKNEIFVPKGYGISQYEMLIFDRWGNLTYESGVVEKADGSNLKGWDGKRAGTGNYCQEDVYLYVIRGKTVRNKPYHKTGHVTLVR